MTVTNFCSIIYKKKRFSKYGRNRKDFNVSIYIVQEIVDYIKLTVQRPLQAYEMENRKALLRLAIINGRIKRE